MNTKQMEAYRLKTQNTKSKSLGSGGEVRARAYGRRPPAYALDPIWNVPPPTGMVGAIIPKLED